MNATEEDARRPAANFTIEQDSVRSERVEEQFNRSFLKRIPPEQRSMRFDSVWEAPQYR